MASMHKEYSHTHRSLHMKIMNDQQTQIKLLVVEDHALFRRGVVDTLNEQVGMTVIGEATNGHEALEKARELMPDLILMDVNMPECDGLEATRNIMNEIPSSRIVMLTVNDDDSTLFDAIKWGACGYLPKSLEPEALTGMIHGVVFRGEAPISRITASRILREFGRYTRQEDTDVPSVADLTPREKEILKLVAQGSTNKEIAKSLTITEHTVKNHLRNILEKLHVRNRVEAATMAVREGLV